MVRPSGTSSTMASTTRRCEVAVTAGSVTVRPDSQGHDRSAGAARGVDYRVNTFTADDVTVRLAAKPPALLDPIPALTDTSPGGPHPRWHTFRWMDLGEGRARSGHMLSCADDHGCGHEGPSLKLAAASVDRRTSSVPSQQAHRDAAVAARRRRAARSPAPQPRAAEPRRWVRQHGCLLPNRPRWGFAEAEIPTAGALRTNLKGDDERGTGIGLVTWQETRLTPRLAQLGRLAARYRRPRSRGSTPWPAAGDDQQQADEGTGKGSH